MTEIEPTALDYFSGGVPTGEYFRMTLQDIDKVSAADETDYEGINRLQELCFIGVMSYFEAFCKDSFAAILNIEPSLVANLKAAGQNVAVDAEHVAIYGIESGWRVGFLLASNFDFGTPRTINALFGSLLKISPFSKDQARQFEQLLRDRNLLVHHGGTFTLKYLEQTALDHRRDLKMHAFTNSRVIGRSEVSTALRLLEHIARKLSRASYDALVNYIAERAYEYSSERQKALHYLSWWGDEAT